MTTIIPRWEWRSFAGRFPMAEPRFAVLTPGSVTESDEIYLLAPGGDNVKIRDGLLDIKVLRETNADGLQRWEPVLKATFPLDPDASRTTLQALGLPSAGGSPGGLTQEALLDLVGRAGPGAPRVVAVHKRRVRYTVGGCAAESTEMEAGGRRTRTIAVESTDPVAVVAAVADLGLADYRNMDVPHGLAALVDGAPERYAVIDAGTNSIKFHVAERAADGSAPWRDVVDRTEVTRLGEGLQAAGAIGPEPLERTVRAIARMAAEADELGVRAVAAVGTAGLRMARDQADVVAAIRARTGVRLEVISGEDEGRLAYLAVAAGIGLGDGGIAVFDTGGGSSQFTFGHGTTVDERFSVNVGAVRFTERFRLAERVSEATLAEALAAIAADLARLDGRPTPDAIVAMGGAVTNLAAVKHGLVTYDPDVVQGTVLDRAEIDRQIERYRATDADGRRDIVGLQPARAEVILAGACIVRTILDKLGRDAITVSDHGLRHGVLIDRFGSGSDAAGG